jgi:hypothetical protein
MGMITQGVNKLLTMTQESGTELRDERTKNQELRAIWAHKGTKNKEQGNKGTREQGNRGPSGRTREPRAIWANKGTKEPRTEGHLGEQGNKEQRTREQGNKRTKNRGPSGRTREPRAIWAKQESRAERRGARHKRTKPGHGEPERDERQVSEGVDG